MMSDVAFYMYFLALARSSQHKKSFYCNKSCFMLYKRYPRKHIYIEKHNIRLRKTKILSTNSMFVVDCFYNIRDISSLFLIHVDIWWYCIYVIIILEINISYSLFLSFFLETLKNISMSKAIIYVNNIFWRCVYWKLVRNK